MSNPRAPYACILAGGAGRRMGGADKGELVLNGKRLVDHVWTRLRPQADAILIAGPNDYGLGAPAAPDREDGPQGPMAGLFAAASWIKENDPEAVHFLTAPIDGPFLPVDLYARLAAGEGAALARAGGRIHATFALWRIDDLLDALPTLAEEKRFALLALADAVNAKTVDFENEEAFLNVNSPEDLEKAIKKDKDG